MVVLMVNTRSHTGKKKKKILFIIAIKCCITVTSIYNLYVLCVVVLVNTSM